MMSRLGGRSLLLAGVLATFLAATPAFAGSTYAYVANGCNNTVSYINTGVPAVVGTASGPALGPAVTGVAVDPNGNWVWVANQFNNTVTVLNAGVPAVFTSFVVGANPVTIDFNPKTGFAYVALAGADQVAVVNAGTYAVVARISVGQAPTRVRVDPKGRFAYVSNQNSNYVSIIDTTTNTVTKSLIVGPDPTTIVFSPDGHFAYIGVGLGNYVAVVDTKSETLVGTITGVVAPLSLTINPDGSLLYVSSQADNAVWLIDTTTNSVIASSTNFFNSGWPGDIAFTPDGTQVYVSNPGSNYVGIIDVASNTLSPIQLVTGCPSLLAIAKPKTNTNSNLMVSINPPAISSIVGIRIDLGASATLNNGQPLNSATFSWSSSAPNSFTVSSTDASSAALDAHRRGFGVVTAKTTQSGGASAAANVVVSADQFFWTDDSNEFAQNLTSVFWKDQGIVFGFSSVNTDLSNLVDPNLVPLWRFLDPSTSTHFWTTDPNGELFTNTPGVIREGIAGYVFQNPEAGTVPIYRFFNPATNVHFWSTDQAGEGIAGTGSGFQLEGPSYWAFPTTSGDPRYAPVHRAGCPQCFVPFNQQ
ncbi:MAG TPA: hypothetical protein VFU86_15375 [Terriglobales bacterium]|nr:hypothetical protein [Terriglobales bacterium]